MLRKPCIDVICPMIPRGKGRPRFSRKSGRAYTPTETRKWEAQCAAILAQHTPEEPLDGPLILDFLCVMPRPGYMFKKDRTGNYKWPETLIYQTKTPDVDNLCKALLDVGTTVKWWRDDCQVVCGMMMKATAEMDGKPRIEIMVSRVYGTPEDLWHMTRRHRGSKLI